MRPHTLPGHPSWREAITALREDPAARAALSRIIQRDPAPALCFEARPCAREGAPATPFEFVLVPSPALARVRADPGPFAAALVAGHDTATFPNLGGDAVLVVPSPEGLPPGAGAHLAAFLRGAPPARADALWRAVALAVEAWWAASPRPLWLGTAGLGVHWLHVRLDARPKYTRHAPYRQAP